MASPIIVAKTGSFDEFMTAYEPTMAASYVSAGQTLLFSSVANRDTDSRVAITTRLLDDGADPSVVAAGVNVLHVLFGYRGHDAGREAPMLGRLIDGGADVNLVSKRFGPPLIGVMINGPRPETANVPFYDAFFERPNLDLSVPAVRSQRTLREYILSNSGFPLLHDYVRAYDG